MAVVKRRRAADSVVAVMERDTSMAMVRNGTWVQMRGIGLGGSSIVIDDDDGKCVRIQLRNESTDCVRENRKSNGFPSGGGKHTGFGEGRPCIIYKRFEKYLRPVLTYDVPANLRVRNRGCTV